MSWRVLVKPLATADVSGLTVSQQFKHPTKKMVLQGAHVGLVGYGNPAFTDLKLRIYSDRNNSPGKLIAESTTTYTKAQVHTQNNFLKFAGFSFNPVQLLANTAYHLVLYPSGYTGNDSSFLAWKYGYPDPQYRTGLDLEADSAARHCFDFCLTGYTIGTDE